MAIGTTTVNFSEANLLNSDRTFEPWTIKVLNDTNFKLRDALKDGKMVSTICQTTKD